ncbi:MAG TPA: plasma-membrane proton-efflux P-type ATPase [Planctomycetota bacterium]|nr:plasma-membrane proton-efflux P-type ATPase [Planctomycetota bacterium]
MTAPTATLDLSKATGDQALDQLHSNRTAGLGKADIEARIKEYGSNEVEDKPPNRALGLLKKFWGLSAWMLELIVALSWFLGRRWDACIVAGLLVINAIISFTQELRAGSAVKALRTRLKVNARVLRDGAWSVLPAWNLVPGDIVRVRSGDFVPADVKMLDGTLGVDQSSLTGESAEVDKKPSDLLYCGSVVRRGEASGVVILTGAKTFFGRTTELVESSRPKLHLEEVISRVVRWLFVIVGTLIAVAVGVSLIQGAKLLEILPLTLVLLLSAVPVALPVMFTVSMAVGAMELAKRGVLVTRLSAAEDAATMDVLCLDKTGTITLNHLSVSSVEPRGIFTNEDALLYGALASQEANQDPLDLAFLAGAKEKKLISPAFHQKTFIPFTPETRRTEAVVEKEGVEFRVTKGAVLAVAKECGLSSEDTQKLDGRATEQALLGFRTLAVARTNAQKGWDLVGLVSLSDPPHPDSKSLIAKLRTLGIAIKMLTGDALPVAREIAKSVGLDSIIRMPDVSAALKGDPKAGATMAIASDGIAEVFPQDKHEIVKGLQAAGHVVGMTGDGVNDAPALRQAEVGVAVENATDVAKGAASVVLTEAGLKNIVDLVTNGRVIYQRILTWIINKISRTILKSGVVVIAFLVTGKFVVSTLAMMVLLFLTDFVKVSLSTDHVQGSGKPETWNIGREVRLGVTLGIAMVVEVLGLLAISWRYFHMGPEDPLLPTFTFQILLYFAMFSLLSIRERRHFWASWPSKMLMGGLAFEFVAGTALSSVGIPGLMPIPITATLAALAYAFIFSLWVNDALKVAWIGKTPRAGRKA